MDTITYGINSAWPGLSETTAEIGRRFVKTLDDLSSLDPWFRSWGVSVADDDSPTEPLDRYRSNIAQFVAGNVKPDDWGEPDPREGYWLFAENNTPPPPSPQTSAVFFVTAGSDWRDKGHFEIGSPPKPPDPGVITYAIYKGAILAMVSNWPAPWACAKCSIKGRKPPTLPGEPPFPYSGFQMPWIAYLNAERAANLGPLQEIITERTPDGGLLMTATKDRFDPANVAHMRPSRQIAEIMIEHAGEPGY